MEFRPIDLYLYMNELADNKRSKEYASVEMASQFYQQLRVYRADGATMLMTTEVNDFVDLFEVVNGQDGKVGVQPYINDYMSTNHQLKIYSMPATLWIAYHNPNGMGLLPGANWKELFAKHHINPHLDKKVDDWMGSRAPVNYL